MKKKKYYSIIVIVFLPLLFIVITFAPYIKQMKSANEKIGSQSQLLKTKFGTMEFAIAGAGRPVLLVHGAGGGFDQGLWLGKICLDSGYQFIAPSKFGYLKSAVPEQYSTKIQAEQYKILLDYLGIEKVELIGVSAGGPSAMAFANDFPERVDHLILLSAVSMPPNQNDKSPFYIKIIQQIQKSDYAYWLFTKAFKTQILSLVGIPSADYKNFSQEQKNLAQEMLDVMHPMSLRYEGTIIDGLIIKNFEIPKNITTPTLIIHSKNDGLVSYSHAVHSSRNIKGSQLILYENGGHGALSEISDVRKQIQVFLNSSVQ